MKILIRDIAMHCPEHFYEGSADEAKNRMGFCYKHFLMTVRLLRKFAQFLTEKMFIRMKYQLLRLGMHGAQRLTWQHMNVLRELSAGKMDEEIAKTHSSFSIHCKKIYITFKGYDRLSKIAQSWQLRQAVWD